MLEDELEKLSRQIQDVLTPDLLQSQYRERNVSNPMFGHCYVATEAFYHMTKDRYPGRFTIFHGKDDEGIVHWWLHDNHRIRILDLTADQYFSVGKVPPYQNNRRGSFLTNEPSKRAITVMNRVKENDKQQAPIS
jgi:hypothetical protein